MMDRALTWSGAAAVAFLVAASLAPAAAAPAPQRTLLRTGQSLPPRGEIGSAAAVALGIDADGRVLVGSPLSDGSQAVAWADDAGLDVLWRSTGDTPRVQGYTAHASADGTQILALGDPLPYSGGFFTPHGALYRLQAGGAVRLLAVGDLTRDGWEVVNLLDVAAVADDGGAALLADLRAPASDAIVYQALLSLDAAGAHVVAGDSDALPAERRVGYIIPLAALAGGGIVFQAYAQSDGDEPTGVYRGDAASMTRVLAAGDLGPDGAILGAAHGLAANRLGEVLLHACPPDAPVTYVGSPDCPIYRSEDGGWIRVRAGVEPTGDGRLAIARGGRLNARGDVALDITWVEDVEPPTSSVSYGAVYHPAGATPRLITAGGTASLRGLNDRGEAALSSPGDIARWAVAGRRALVTPLSTTPDGLRLIGGGIGQAVCLADDGRVAALTQFADGADWVCVDDAGAHLLSRPPAGRESIDLCAFAGDEVVVLSGGTIARLDGRRATPVLRRGERLPDGSTLVSVADLAAHASGTIAAVVSSAASQMVIRQAPGETWESVDVTRNGAESVQSVLSVGITASGRIVAGVASDSGVRDVVVVDPDGATRTLVRDSRDGSVRTVAVRGEAVLVAIARFDPLSGSQTTTLLVFDPASGRVRTQLDDGFAGPDTFLFAVDVGADGTILAGSSDASGAQSYWLSDGGAPVRLPAPDRAAYGEAGPVGLTSSTEVLFRASTSESGAFHSVLSTSAQQIAGVCPAAAPAGGDSGGGGCNVGASARGGARPLAAGGAVLALVVLLRRARPPRRE